MISCLIGFTFLFSSIFALLNYKNHDIFIKFYKLLNQQQKKIYQKIIHERTMIYILGMLLGLILGIYYLYNSEKENYRICKFLVIIYVIKLGFYYLYPKSPLMLYSLTTKNQTDAWANIYTYMKKRWKLSLIIGFFGYLLLSSYICKQCKNK